MSNDLSHHTEDHLPANITFFQKNSFDEDLHQKVDGASVPIFNQLLQFAPEAMVAHEAATKQYMLVISEGALLRAKDGFGYRGMSVGSDGKIASHARLFDPKNLKNVVTVSIAMKAVTMAVGQAHLAEISNQLKSMNSKLGEIKKFLDNERSSEIDAIDMYFNEYFQSSSNGFDLSDVRRSQLESDSRKIDAILLHLNRETGMAIDQSKSYVDKSFFGSDTYFEKLNELMQDCFNALTQWISVAKVKAKSVQALLLSDEFELFEQRKAVFMSQLDEIQSKEIALFRSVWIERINSFTSKTSSDKELAAKRNKLRERLEYYIQNLKELISTIVMVMDDLDYTDQKNEVILEVVGGKVAGVFLNKTSSSLLIENENKFFSLLGKKDDSFVLVPKSASDDALMLYKEIEDAQKEEKRDMLKATSNEAISSAKEAVSDVGGKIGGMFKKIKW
jgi:hypothetical protein